MTYMWNAVPVTSRENLPTRMSPTALEIAQRLSDKYIPDDRADTLNGSTTLTKDLNSRISTQSTVECASSTASDSEELASHLFSKASKLESIDGVRPWTCFSTPCQSRLDSLSYSFRTDSGFAGLDKRKLGLMPEAKFGSSSSPTARNSYGLASVRGGRRVHEWQCDYATKGWNASIKTCGTFDGLPPRPFVAQVRQTEL